MRDRRRGSGAAPETGDLFAHFGVALGAPAPEIAAPPTHAVACPACGWFCAALPCPVCGQGRAGEGLPGPRLPPRARARARRDR